MIRLGLIRQPMRPAQPVTKRVREHLARGTSVRQLVEMSGITAHTIASIAGGNQRRVRPLVARAIMEVPFLPTPVGLQRRVRALFALGWRITDITSEQGLSKNVIISASSGKNLLDGPEPVLVAYEALSGSQGPSQRTRLRAAQQGWAPPAAWDGIDIDDPAAKPDFGKKPNTHTVDVDEAQYLLSCGTPIDEVARRVGCKVDTLRGKLNAIKVAS